MAAPTGAISLYTTSLAGTGLTAQIANKVDVLDFITNITPTQTPLFSTVKKGTAVQALHEWLTDSLRLPAAGGVPEGNDAGSNTSITTMVRDKNYTQIFQDTVIVSGSAEKTTQWGIKSFKAYQTEKKMKEQALDIEWAIINNTTAGQAGDPRKMRPLLDFIASGNQYTSTASVSETDLNKLMQLAVAGDMVTSGVSTSLNGGGGQPDIILCCPAHRRDISAMTVPSGTYRQIPAADKTVVRAIDFYESDFGPVKIVWSRMVPLVGAAGTGTRTAYVYALDTDYLRFDFLRPTFYEDLAKSGDSTKGHIITEGCIVGLNTLAHAAASLGTAYD